MRKLNQIQYGQVEIYEQYKLTFSSSRIIEILCPFGVPHVSNSIPSLAMSPLGLASLPEDIFRIGITPIANLDDD